MGRASKTDWKRLGGMRDKDIDTGDIRQLDDAFFQKAKVRPPSKRRPTAKNPRARAAACSAAAGSLPRGEPG